LKYEAGFEAHFIPRALRFAAGLAMHNFGHVSEVKPGVQSMSIRSLVPALAAGCTTAIKMPHQAAQTAQLMSEMVASVKEIPKGVVNVFIESGAEGAKLLVSSTQVKVVSYTGSTATGRAIAKAAAGTFKRLNLELGGKTPHLIFDDAYVEALLPVLEKSCTVLQASSA
jgi:betaine-aldehyde dehydrogenase